MTSAMAIDLAQRRLNDFQKQCGEYGEAALHLAYHAALPVALNAELLHLLRINFFLDPPEILPYTVEFEFLLSPLCREIDEGLYEIEPEIRDLLLVGLTQTYDTQRTRDIAILLWQYIDHCFPWADRVELERAQQLTALNFLNPEKAQQWLATVGTEVSRGQAATREWFVAMRQNVQNQAQLLQGSILTEVQQQLYDWLFDYIKQNRHPPSIRQMMRAMGLNSPAPIQNRLEHLRLKGYIEWTEGKARSIRLTCVDPLESEHEESFKESQHPTKTPKATIRDQIFISYSHQDKAWLTKLQTMLKPLIRDKVISVWDDTHIKVGAKWRKDIENALASAKVAVFLVSPDFLASDFIAENELPSLLDAEQQGLTVVWVLLSSCLYKYSKIVEYQAAHDLSQPLDSLSPAEQNKVLEEICRRIQQAV
ncbi:MAG: TIR domain-containing protein [Leptolyngbyaceae cyanobacterium bins.302]|nr:TIR domain-containing protein [Leptolyngbyaceae cyanobacterium bins.302]